MDVHSHPQAGDNASLPQAPLDYYSSPTQDANLEAKFLNIDHLQNYAECIKKLGIAETKNFVTDVWSDSAWCAVDLGADEIKSLLKAKRPSRLHNGRWIETRWINFWGGDLQPHAVGAVAAYYGLSPRLKGLMCAAAVQTGPPTDDGAQKPSQWDRGSSEASNEKLQDEEAAVAAAASERPGAAIQTLKDMDLSEIKWGHIVNEIWHWHSVDWGQRYLCLGYNSIFTIKGVKLDNGLNKPEGKRIWTWLVLCDDGTVISVYENPFPHMAPDVNVLKTVRRNVRNVFHHLSSVCNTAGHPSTLMTIQIRDFHIPTQSLDSLPSLEAASKLLYYLFDDWITTYGLVAKKEHPYGSELESLRDGMFEVARVDLVDNLHKIGRRLAVLKRVYQSYDQMITRILQRQRLLRDEARKEAKGQPEAKEQPESRPALYPPDQEPNEHRPSLYHTSTTSLQTSEDMPLGVPLSSSAIVRFERLLDRIKLYAVSEIEECLTEKEALVFMVCPAPFICHTLVSLTLLEL
jgi:hypothetical protein